MANKWTFKFEGVDYWSRPVFKCINNDVRIGSVEILFPNKEIAPNCEPEKITEFFRNNKHELVIFGTSPIDEDDPLGTPIKKSITIDIID